MTSIPQIKIKIYLKTMKKPLMFVLSNEAQLQHFVDKLSSENLVKFGDIIFSKDSFIYAEITRETIS